MKKANELSDSDQLVTVQNIYEWVLSHITASGYRGAEHGALYTLSEKRGDCTEFADLFTALCRAAGIPVRRVSGYVCNESRKVDPHEYHDWAEFYNEGRWRLADVHAGKFMEDQSSYVAMNIKGPPGKLQHKAFNRFRVETEGVGMTMN